MKIKGFILIIIGLVIGYNYSQYKEANKQIQLYGTRDVSSDIKKEIDRVNIILNDVEKKHIKKNNVPKPAPPTPEIACKCNGTKEIVQPDGNRSQCQCSKDGGDCKCKPKEEPPVQTQPQIQYIPVNP